MLFMLDDVHAVESGSGTEGVDGQSLLVSGLAPLLGKV